MATTFVDYTGDGNATKSFSFPSIKEADIKVEVDNVIKTSGNHYNITSYTTTGGGNVVFTSGNIPSSPAQIRIFRDTDVDSAKATFTAGSSVKANDLNNNMTQILYAAQEEQNQTVITSDIKAAAITTATIKDANVTTAKIATDAITNDKIADGAVRTAHIFDGQVTTAKIADDAIITNRIADSSVTTAKIADDAVTNAKIGNNAVGTNEILNGAVTSAKIDNGTIQTVDIADGQITTAKIADNDVTADKLAHTSVTAGSYTAADITVDAQGRLTSASSGTIATSEIADGAVTTAKLDTGSVTTAKIGSGQVILDKLADNSVNTTRIIDGNVTTAKIADANITTAKIANANITAAKIATNAVTTDKIADSELTTLAGMQAGTASKLADSTALTADIADLNQIDGMAKQTTITDDDTKFPTSGAVVDYVAAQLEPFGGFEAIANESSFPNTQPASGVVISIADAGGMAVSGSGTASGATVGGTTVNITGIASNFNGSTINSGVRFLVVSTGSGQNYTYHKATLKEADLVSLSGDINDFAERYRVGASNPTTSLDSGDLFFNTGSGKLLVYNGSNSAWEETQSVGNFFINTISSSSATGGGSATPNGTAYRFTISNAGADAQQHLVSVDGVIQKPNSGTSQPSEGFAIDGGDIIFGSAPVNGASIFIITIGASVSIGTPSNNTVTTAILQNGSVTTAKITDANVTTAKIADQAVTLAKLPHGTSSNDGKFLRANNGADPTFEVVNTDLVADTSPQLGGQLDTNGNDIVISDGEKLSLHTYADVKTKTGSTTHVTQNSLVLNADHDIWLATSGNKITFGTSDSATHEVMRVQCAAVGASQHGFVNLNYVTANAGGNASSATKLQTTSTGITVTGTVAATSYTGDGSNLTGINTDLVSDTSPQLGGGLDTNGHDIHFGDSGSTNDDNLYFGAGNDLRIYHDGSHSRIVQDTSGYLIVQANNYLFKDNANSDTTAHFKAGAEVELYYNGSKKFETISNGVSVTDRLGIGTQSPTDNLHVVGTSLLAGNTYVTGNFYNLADNKKIHAGAGNDARMYHDGSDSYFDSITGHLYIYNHASNKDLIFGTEGSTRWKMSTSGNFIPATNNAIDIGTSSYRVRNIYTNDLHLSNEGHSNDVDGSWGNWTIQEGESDLFLKNNRSGKKYKFNLTEVS